MTNPEAMLQMARLTGRSAFYETLGFPEGNEPGDLDGAQLERLHRLVDGQLDGIVTELVNEAMASDDVTDSTAAVAYLRDRIDFLGELLDGEQRARISEGFGQRVAAWESTPTEP